MAAEGPSDTPSARHPGAAFGGGAGPHGGVDVHTADGVAAVRFWGSVDLDVRLNGTAALGQLRGSSAPMTVDCRDVTFMDSTGLSVLVRIVRDASSDGRPVRFLGATPQVADLLHFTGVDAWMSGLGVRGES